MNLQKQKESWFHYGANAREQSRIWLYIDVAVDIVYQNVILSITLCVFMEHDCVGFGRALHQVPLVGSLIAGASEILVALFLKLEVLDCFNSSSIISCPPWNFQPLYIVLPALLPKHPHRVPSSQWVLFADSLE